MGQQAHLIISIPCQEPDGVPANRFVTDKGMLPAAVPGVSGSKVMGVSNTSAAFGEAIPTIVEGSAEVEAAEALGTYKKMEIAGSPPTATWNPVDNGNIVTFNAEGKAVLGAAGSEVGVLVPGDRNYSLKSGDKLEVLLK